MALILPVHACSPFKQFNKIEAGIWAPLHGDQQHTGTLVMSILDEMISPGGRIVVGFSSWLMMLTSFSMYLSTEDKPNSAT